MKLDNIVRTTNLLNKSILITAANWIQVKLPKCRHNPFGIELKQGFDSPVVDSTGGWSTNMHEFRNFVSNIYIGKKESTVDTLSTWSTRYDSGALDFLPRSPIPSSSSRLLLKEPKKAWSIQPSTVTALLERLLLSFSIKLLPSFQKVFLCTLT